MPADVPLSPPTWRNAVLRYVLAIAATHQAKSEASLTKLNELRAALAGRRMDVDTP